MGEPMKKFFKQFLYFVSFMVLAASFALTLTAKAQMAKKKAAGDLGFRFKWDAKAHKGQCLNDRMEQIYPMQN